VASIVTHHWAVKPEAGYEIFDYLLRTCLTEGVYIGAALRKYRELKEDNNKKNIYRLNAVTYGVPLLRIV
jgi:hypothetical protein